MTNILDNIELDNDFDFDFSSADFRIGDLNPTRYIHGSNEAHEYNGYRFLVALLDDKPPRTVGVVRNDAIDEAIDKLNIAKQFNYYITKNSFIHAGSRKGKFLLGLNTIMIDIDCHNENISKQYRDDLIMSFCDYIAPLDQDNTEKDISKIVMTGRGVQIHIKLKQASAKLSWLYDKVVLQQLDKYGQILNQFYKDCGFNHELEIDYSASKNKAGLMRLENTYNVKSKTMAQVHYSNGNEYDLNDLNTEPRNPNPKQFVKFNIHKSSKVNIDKLTDKSQRLNKSLEYYNLENWRINFIENEYEIKEGFRNKTLLIYYNSLITINKSITEARFLLNKLNDSLDKPIHEAQIKATMRYIESGTLIFRQSTFYEWLGLENRKTKQQVEADKKSMKQKQHRQIKKLLSDEDLTYQEIADMAGVSLSTIKRHAIKNNQTRNKNKN